MNQVLCKWVSENMMTMNDTKWVVGVPNELPEKDKLMLCEPGLFHYMKHPLIAIMFKYFNLCEDYSKLYEVKPEGKIVEGWDKCGATKLTLIKQLEIPKITDAQQVAFGILCAKEVYKEPKFVSWADKWLSGEDRSEQSNKTADANFFISYRLTDDDYCAASYATRAALHANFESYRHYWPDTVTRAAYFAGRANSKKNKEHLDMACLAEQAMKIQ